MMRLIESEGVDNQYFYSFKIRIFLLAHRLHVRDIGKLAETIAQNRHLIMENTDRNEFDIAYPIRMMRLYGMKLELRSSRIKLFGILRKTVRHGIRQRTGYQFITIDMNISKHAETTQVIDTSHMVVMDMRNQHTIQLAERFPEQLHPYVRTRIYQNTGILRLYHRSTSKALILRIPASANLTIASQNRNTTRCSCSQQSNLHLSSNIS